MMTMTTNWIGGDGGGGGSDGGGQTRSCCTNLHQTFVYLFVFIVIVVVVYEIHDDVYPCDQIY